LLLGLGLLTHMGPSPGAQPPHPCPLQIHGCAMQRN
jgi:hypothetical protein